MGVKVTGFDKVAAQLNAFATQMSEEKQIRLVLREAAEPIRKLVKAGLAYHKVTGLTEKDIIVGDMPMVEPGVVRVAVGARGGKNGRAYILRFLEAGTSHNKAYPVLRPAWDSEEKKIVPRIIAILKRKFGPNLQGLFKK